jgi:GT2 family glycosyltransferase
MSDPASVSVVITTYNQGLEYLPALLRSLAAQDYEDHEVTVVADGGDPEVVAYLEREWPGVRVIPLPEPRGYAGATALGIRSTDGRYIALLNDDVELEPKWLGLLVAELDRDPDLGFVTGKTLLYDQREVINETKQDLYTCGRFVPCGLLEHDEGQWDSRLPAVSVSASTALYRREALEAAGGFDEDYFMYCEDVDLGLRALTAGYRGLYIPEPVAYHVAGAKTGKTPEMPRRMLYRNQLITLVKDVPWAILWRALPKILLFLQYQYRVERSNGAPHVARSAYTEFLKMLPSTLRKRRGVQRKRIVSPAGLRAQMRSDYPFPTRWRRVAQGRN